MTDLPADDHGSPGAPTSDGVPAFTLERVGIAYRGVTVLRDVALTVPARGVQAWIGPSGTGKSSLLKALNRMLDLEPGATVSGCICFRDTPIDHPAVDPIVLRRRVGMLLQQPTTFPQSIRDNVAFGAKAAGIRGGMRLRVRRALEMAGLWDEVAHRMDAPGPSLSEGQQQRLCLARVLAADPQVILMDEPSSALDLPSTLRLEDQLRRLADTHAIVLVTNDLRQASRVSDRTAVFGRDGAEGSPAAVGVLLEEGPTRLVFTTPVDERTRDYITISGD